MEKQRNRGQDGSGVASIKIGLEPGKPYIDRLRAIGSSSIQDIYKQISEKFNDAREENPKKYLNEKWVKRNVKLPPVTESSPDSSKVGVKGG